MRNEIDVHDILPRLKAEAKENKMAWLREGERDGVRWARTAKFGDLKECALVAVALLSDDAHYNSFKFPEELEDDLHDLHHGARGPAFDCGQYTEGWLTGVLGVWHKVEPEL